jgi:Family of unknown function (DUF6632)
MHTHLSEYLHPGGEENRYARSHDLKLLRIVMVLVGVIFIAGIYPLMVPSGWTWHTGHSDYPLMIVDRKPRLTDRGAKSHSLHYGAGGATNGSIRGVKKEIPG